MNFFDQLYLTIFNRFKGRYKQKANTIALYYTSILQIALLFLGGVFFIKFLEQMIVWHKTLVEKTRIKLNLSYYQLYWICFIKGVVVCYILMLFLK